MNETHDEFFGYLNKTQNLLLFIWVTYSIFDAFVYMSYRNYLVANSVQLNSVWYFVVWHMSDFNNVPIVAFLLEIPIYFIVRNRYVSVAISALCTLGLFYHIEFIQSKDHMDYPIVIFATFLYLIYRLSKKDHRWR